jgi:peptidyl-tRNA hydrolase, PTH1 family
MLRVTTSTAVENLLIVGLGNPGPEYARSRHNMGRWCLEAFARRVGVSLSRKRWDSVMGSETVAGRRLWLIEPQTFMNLSGAAVRKATKDLGIGPESVWVVYDEIDLPLCRLRIRVGGSSAGHNGIKSIIGSLGGDGFVRFRVGVGRPASRGSGPGVRHVLGRFSRAETAVVERIIQGVSGALEEALRSGIPPAMDLYNRAGSLGCEELP